MLTSDKFHTLLVFFIRDTLPRYPCILECGIVSLNTSDSYGQITPVEIQRHLKTGSEFVRGKEVIQRNTDIVQAVNMLVRGHLCVFVLKSLTNGEKFQTILNHMQHYGYT